MTSHKSNSLLDDTLLHAPLVLSWEAMQTNVLQVESKVGHDKSLRQEVHRQMRLKEAAEQETAIVMVHLQGTQDELNMVSSRDQLQLPNVGVCRTGVCAAGMSWSQRLFVGYSSPVR